MDIQKQARRLTAHYAAAFAVYFAAYCAIRTFIAVYLLDLGFTHTQIGIITGIHLLVTALIQPYFAQILNHFPRLGLKRFIAICTSPAIGCSLLTYVLPANMFTFVPIYILLGLTESGMQSLMVSVGMEYVNAGIPIAPGAARGIGSIGYASASVLLGAVINRFGSQISQAFNIFFLVVFIALLLALPDVSAFESVKRDEKAFVMEPSDNMGVFLRNNAVYAFFILSVVFIFFGQSTALTYLPDVVGQFGLGTDFIGLLNAIAAGLELIPMFFYVQINKKVSALTMLKISAVFFLAKVLLITLARSGGGLIFAVTMQIFAYAIFMMASIYFTNQVILPRNRVMAQGLVVGANEGGNMIGSLFGGIIMDHFTVRTLLWSATGINAIGSVMMFWAIILFQRQEKGN